MRQYPPNSGRRGQQNKICTEHQFQNYGTAQNYHFPRPNGNYRGINNRLT